MGTVFREASATDRKTELPLAHISVELGHLYMEDLTDEKFDLVGHFTRIVPWVQRSQLASMCGVAESRLRVSTCVLVDDYFSAPLPPTVAVPKILDAARAAGLRIDYVARESACAQQVDVSLAALLEGAIVADPTPGTNGARPPVHETGWLSNGARSPAGGGSQAMRTAATWRPPVENAARRHSVFVDVELWREAESGRQWSCAFLAAVWQALRLGQLRLGGESPVRPVDLVTDTVADTWSDFPAVMRTSPQAPSLFAYRTFSVLGDRFLSIEHAVRVILNQIAVDPLVTTQTNARAVREDVPLPTELPERISYLFLGG